METKKEIDAKKLAAAMSLLGIKADLRDEGTPEEFVLVKKDKMEWHIWNVCGYNMYNGEYSWETAFYYYGAMVYDGVNHKNAFDVVANIQDDIKQFYGIQPHNA